MRRFETAGARSESVRQANLAAVLRTVHLDGPATRSGLVAATGLTRSAIGALVGELVDLGLVVEQPSAAAGRPGRPSPLVSPDPSNVVVAMEALVDSIAVAAVSLGGEVVAIDRSERPRAELPVEPTIANLTAMTTELLAGLPAGARVHAVALAVAGVVRRDGTVMFAPNIGWHDVAVADLLGEALGLGVPVVIGNDGDMGALGESRRGAAAGVADLVYVAGEVGVGGGIIAGGRQLGGRAGFAGEIGHVPVVPDGRPCKCGARGCWETEIGEGALLRRTGRAPDGGRAAVDEVLAAAAAGDAATLAALCEHGRWVGVGLAGVINVFDPEMVVLGGLLARIHPYIADALADELRARVFEEIRAQTTVAPAGLGGDAPLVGAAELAWDLVLRDPARGA